MSIEQGTDKMRRREEQLYELHLQAIYVCVCGKKVYFLLAMFDMHVYEGAGDAHCLDVLNVGINQMPEKGRKDIAYTRGEDLVCEWTMPSCVLHIQCKGCLCGCANVEVRWRWGAEPLFYPNAVMKEPVSVLLKKKGGLVPRSLLTEEENTGALVKSPSRKSLLPSGP